MDINKLIEDATQLVYVANPYHDSDYSEYGARELAIEIIKLTLGQSRGVCGWFTTLPRSNNCPAECKFYSNDTSDNDEYFVERCLLGGKGYGFECPAQKLGLI
jgi:hypothetical protein